MRILSPEARFRAYSLGFRIALSFPFNTKEK